MMNRSAFLRRLPALLLALALLATLAACRRADAPGDGDGPAYRRTEDAPPIDERTFPPVSAYPDEGDLGDYHVKIKDFFKTSAPVTDTLVNPLILVTYEFTNNSRKPISFSEAIQDYVFRNNSECFIYTEIPPEVTLSEMEGFDLSLALKAVAPGETVEVCRLYDYSSIETPIDVYLTTGSLFEEEKLAKTFLVNPDEPEPLLSHDAPNVGDYFVEEDIYYGVVTTAETNYEMPDYIALLPYFSNPTPVPVRFFECMELHVYQDGEELDRIEDIVRPEFYVMNSGDCYLELYYYLQDTESSVTVEIYPIGEPDKKIVDTLPIGSIKNNIS